jgi:DNA modification methylase
MIDIKIGDCREVLKTLPEKHFQTCITSPPYYGLRDYGTGTWVGGNENCSHVSGTSRNDIERQYGASVAMNTQYSDVCKECGAKRIDSQIGLEKTPEEFIENLVIVFREIKRVLKDDGTLWLNLGDSYSSGGRTTTTNQSVRGDKDYGVTRPPPVEGIKPKDLFGIPWRVAFALQSDGWYLRQDIIWHKPNPMPESVQDRCTKSHEYIFLLSKSPHYYFDNEAIKEEALQGTDYGILRSKKQATLNHPSITKRQNENIDSKLAGDGKRNKRSVWTVPTKPYKEAHFAVFPTDLIEPCVLAGSSAKICSGCGKSYRREMVTTDVPDRIVRDHMVGVIPKRDKPSRMNSKDMLPLTKEDNGFVKQCECDTDHTEQDRIIDPFGGSGTTALVADRHNRDATVIELNEQYIEIAKNRLEGDAPLFAKVEIS